VFYSLAYSLATISAFGVLMAVTREMGVEQNDVSESYEAFNGLGKKNPALAFVLTVSMLSLAGIPLTAGFWGKFFVFSNVVDRGLTWMLIFAVLMSAVGIYYYFRPIIASYMRIGEAGAIKISPFYRLVLIGTAIVTIVLGIFPDLLRGIL
jgi:NADH-quinone oxidoreductase subunit N